MADDFDEVLFPEDISEGSAGGPEFNTTVVELGSGNERRDQNWTLERGRWDLVYGVKDEADLTALLDFFRLRRGKARGFRFRDPKDSTVVNTIMQAIGETSETTDYQMVKRYTDAVTEYVRTITKIVASPAPLVSVDAALKTEGVDYEIDYNTGIISFYSGVQSESAVIGATFTFDVPVRFDTDFLPEVLETYKAGRATVPIVELK
jgi:uncharacterized protein (TIGR02217 family)